VSFGFCKVYVVVFVLLIFYLVWFKIYYFVVFFVGVFIYDFGMYFKWFIFDDVCSLGIVVFGFDVETPYSTLKPSFGISA
jgi:hypothetical protein